MTLEPFSPTCVDFAPATVQSWEVSDELWAKAEPLLAEHNPREGRPRRRHRRLAGGGRAVGGNRSRRGRSSPRWYMYCAQAVSGKRCRTISAVAASFISASSGGGTTGSSCACGRRALPNMTKWKGSLGLGRASTARWPRRRSPKRPLDPNRPIGGRKYEAQFAGRRSWRPTLPYRQRRQSP